MRIPRRPALAFVFSSFATTSLADLSAHDVWGEWRTLMESFGYQISVSEQDQANGLALDGLQVAIGLDTHGSRAVMDIGHVDFFENQDGSVNVSFAPQVPARITLTPPEGETVAFGLVYRQMGLQMRVSGDPAAMHYDFDADSVDISLADFVLNGEAIPAAMMRMGMTLYDLQGTSETAQGDKHRVAKAFSAARMTYDIAMNDPSSTETAKISGSTADLRFAGTSLIPDGSTGAVKDPGSLLRAGFGVNGEFTYGPSQMQIAANGPQGPFSGTASASGGGVIVDVSDGAIGYATRQTDLNVNMAAAASPLPIAFEVAKSAFNLQFPLQPSDTPSDFAFGFEFEGFSMSDMIWGLFDAAGQLPRDPATIALGLSGKMRVLQDMLDPTAIAATGTSQASPAELQTLNIDRLELSVAGADLTGTGAFAFDNSLAPGGLPKPAGGVSLRLTGANTLLDTLVNMGLLPPEQAMGARMMLGMLAIPGDGDDTLISDIEINAQGHVIANGQRIQ
jgi:hypothetical protein